MIMKLKFIIIAGAAFLPLIGGCAITPTPLASIGPGPDHKAWTGPEGYLQVFTATQTVDADFHAYFNVHVGYDIDDASGKLVKYVANHFSDLDESVDTVSLAPGAYTVVARSTWCGLMKIPVVVERGVTTSIHLDGNNWWPPSRPAGNQLVFLPNGEAAGWKSAIQ
jgi:hypothetical protein